MWTNWLRLISLFHPHIGFSRALFPKSSQDAASAPTGGESASSKLTGEIGMGFHCRQETSSGSVFERDLDFMAPSSAKTTRLSTPPTKNEQLHSGERVLVRSDESPGLLSETAHGYGKKRKFIQNNSEGHLLEFQNHPPMHNNMNEGLGKSIDLDQEESSPDTAEENYFAERNHHRSKTSKDAIDSSRPKFTWDTKRACGIDNLFMFLSDQHAGSQVELDSFWSFVKGYLKKNVLNDSPYDFVVASVKRKAFKSYASTKTRYPPSLQPSYKRGNFVGALFSFFSKNHVEQLNLYEDYQSYMETLHLKIRCLVEQRGENNVHGESYIDWVKDLTSKVLFLVKLIKTTIRPKGAGSVTDLQAAQNKVWEYSKKFWNSFPPFNEPDTQKILQNSYACRIEQGYETHIKNRLAWYRTKIDMACSWHLFEAWISEDSKEEKLWDGIVSKDLSGVNMPMKNFYHDTIIFYFLDRYEIYKNVPLLENFTS